MSWILTTLSAALGVFLGTVAPSPLFWSAVLIALVTWRWVRVRRQA